MRKKTMPGAVRSASRIEELEAQLSEAHQIIHAIRAGEVDALVVATPEGDKAFTLEGADHPYRVFIEQMNEGAVTLTPQGLILYCNPRFASMLKMPAEKLIGSSFFDLITDGVGRKQARDAFLRQMPFESSLMLPRGKQLPVSISPREMPGQGQPVYCVVVTDLSERREKEGLRALSECSPDAIMRFDAGLRCIYGNAMSVRILGTDPAGKDLDGLGLSAERTALLRKRLNEAFSTGMQKSFELTGDPRTDINYVLAIVIPESGRTGEIASSIVIYRDITQRKRQEILSRTLNNITQRVYSAGDLSEKVNGILAEAANAIGCDSAAVSLRRGEHWEPVYLHGLPAEAIGQKTDDDQERHAALAIKTKTPVFIGDTLNDERVNREYMKRWNIRAAIAIPLIAAGRVLGAAHFNYHKGTRAFAESHIDFSRKFGEMMSLAFLNAMSTQRLAILSEIAGELLRSSEPRQIMETICSRVMKHLGCQVFVNYLVDEKAGKLRLNACEGFSEEDKRKLEWLDFGSAICGCVARDGSRIVAEHIDARDDPRTCLVKPLGIKAYACHPLLSEKGTVVGTLSFGSSLNATFEKNDLAMMKLVAGQASAAISRIKNLQSLREAETRFRNVLENSIDAAYRRDLYTDTYDYMSPAIEKIMGFSVQEFTRLSTEDILKAIHPDDVPEVERVIKKIISTDAVSGTVEYRLKGKDGIYRWLSDSIHVLKDEKGKPRYRVGIVRDVTENKKAQEALRRHKETLECLVKERTGELMKSYKDLERARRMADIGRLSATIAHEIRNPLSGIQAAAYNIRKKAKNPLLDKHLDTINKKVLESDLIIQNLLAFTRIKTVNAEKFSVFGMLKECIAGVSSKYTNWDVALTEKFDCAPEDHIEADPVQFKMLMNNILDNAYQAMRKKAGTITVSARKEKDKVWKIAVTDTGEGMEAHVRARLFEPFHTTKSKGTGLGLAVCREIVDLHKGKIEVQTAPGRGTTFTILLPSRYTPAPSPAAA